MYLVYTCSSLYSNSGVAPNGRGCLLFLAITCIFTLLANNMQVYVGTHLLYIYSCIFNQLWLTTPPQQINAKL